MTSRDMNRRQFLKSGAVSLGALPIARASSFARIAGANDRVRVGVVGFSDPFRSSLLPAFLQHSKDLNFEIVAVSDIWDMRREAAQSHIGKLTGKPVDAVRNNDELYERKDVGRLLSRPPTFSMRSTGWRR